MKDETPSRVARRAIDLRPPRAAEPKSQYYLIEDAVGNTTWLRGVELLAQPAPAKVKAIAWRL